MAHTVYKFEVAISSREDNWARSQENIARVIKNIFKQDDSLELHNIELIEEPIQKRKKVKA